VRFAAKQKPHRPGIAPALGLRAGHDGFLIVTQTTSRKETLMNRITFSRRPAQTQRRRPASVRLQLEFLEARSLLAGSTLGPLVQVTGTDPFAASTADSPSSQPGTLYPGSVVEPYLAVNPTNPKNLVGVWTQDEWSNGGGRGIGIAVSFNGGNSWKTGMMQGLTLTAGGTFQRAGDSWLSFAPNGDLYFTTILVDITSAGAYVPGVIDVAKSTDGGLDWSAPTTLIESSDAKVFNDKDSITADPTAPGYAYAVWDRSEDNNSSSSPVLFTRTSNGGQSWSTPSTIFDPGGNNIASFNQLEVSPNGTLRDFVNVIPFNTGSHTMTLSLLQSADQGNTWSSKPSTVASILSIAVTDPNNGQIVDAADAGVLGGAPVAFSVAEDPHNGNLYAVWSDARFSNSQFDSIAFAMSADGGTSWSAPIKINQTPSNLPAADQQAFLPSIAVAANGTVAVSYYDFRFNGSGPGLLTDYWLVQGNPVGTGGLANPANWGQEVRLTNTSFNLEQASVRRGSFIGDYQGLAVAGNDFDAFFAATNGTDPGDIFFRDPPAVGGAVPSSMGGAPVGLAGSAAVSLSAGVVPSDGGTRARDVGVDGSTVGGGLAETVADPVFAVVGDEVALGAHPTPQAVVVNGLSSAPAALPRFDALLAMGASARTMGLPKDNGMRDLLFASLS
jgi:hypothetical protein